MSETLGPAPPPGDAPKPPRYWTGAHTTHRLRLHMVFTPKYRKRVLRGALASRLEELLREACEVSRWELHELSVLPDHVHLLVQCRPKDSVASVAQRLKTESRRGARAGYCAWSSRSSPSSCGGAACGRRGTSRRR